MDESKKPLVSLRLRHADLERLGTIARRLRVRESEIVRVALRLTFAKLSPLLDETAHGSDLIPVFLDCGCELIRHSDLDPQTLEALINGSLDNPDRRVDRQDIELISALPGPGYQARALLKGPPQQEIGRLGFPDAAKQRLNEKYVEPRNRFPGLDTVLTSFLQVPL